MYFPFLFSYFPLLWSIIAEKEDSRDGERDEIRSRNGDRDFSSGDGFQCGNRSRERERERERAAGERKVVGRENG